MNHLACSHDGQTPLTSAELEGLIPAWISTQGDVDLAEQDNISAALNRFKRPESSRRGSHRRLGRHRLRTRMITNL